MSPKDAEGMANSVDPDQTAPLGAVWSGSEMFAQVYLSENLGSLRYLNKFPGLQFLILNISAVTSAIKRIFLYLSVWGYEVSFH